MGLVLGRKPEHETLCNFRVKCRTRAAHDRRLHPLYTEKHKVSCSGFLPNTSPMQHPCSQTRMHCCSAALQTPCIYAHGNKTWQQSCSPDNAICNHRFQNALELRTHDEPRIAKHHQGTNRAPKRTDRTRRAHEVPFIAGRLRSDRDDGQSVPLCVLQWVVVRRSLRLLNLWLQIACVMAAWLLSCSVHMCKALLVAKSYWGVLCARCSTK